MIYAKEGPLAKEGDLYAYLRFPGAGRPWSSRYAWSIIAKEDWLRVARWLNGKLYETVLPFDGTLDSLISGIREGRRIHRQGLLA